MVRSCCAPGCTVRDSKETRAQGIKFYRFPQGKEKRVIWLNALKRKNFHPNSHTAICSAHFIGGERSHDPLSPAFAPAIFATTSVSAIDKLSQDLERYHSAKRRQQRRDEEQRVQEEAEAANTIECESCDLHIDSCVCLLNTSRVKTQTEVTIADLNKLEEDYSKRLQEQSEVESASQSTNGYPTKEELKNNPSILRLYTGLSDFTVLMAIFTLVTTGVTEHHLSKLDQFQCFTLVLMKLHLNASVSDLAFRFCVSPSTASRVFSKWLEIMTTKLSFLISWPTRDCLHKTMPLCFRPQYGLRITSIIDCFEIFIEKPSSYLPKACTWSNYKHYNTAKYLISITPQGTISYISKGWGGRVSDKYIVENSGYLRYLIPGDLVLADRGFDVADSVAMQGAILNIPAFTKGKEQLPPSEVESTRKLANARVHVERVIGALRQRFQILSATSVLPKELLHIHKDGVTTLDVIVKLCCALNNLCEGVIPFD